MSMRPPRHRGFQNERNRNRRCPRSWMPSVSRLKVPVSECCTVPCGQSGHSPSKPSRLAMQREGGVKRHYYGLYGSAPQAKSEKRASEACTELQ
ncbi:hypothetical protein V8C43DRAFT_269292 [Trichoderma afarasin]